MRTYLAVAAFTVFLGLAGLAQAADLLSAPLPINSRTNVGITGACRVMNTGTSAVAVQVSLFSNNGFPGYDADTCHQAPLPGGQACYVLAYAMPADSYAACKVTASSVSKLRGTFEVWENEWPITVRVAEELK